MTRPVRGRRSAAGGLVGGWWFAVLLLFVAAVPSAQQRPDLGSAERIADGVLLYRLDDPDMLNPAGHVSVQALQLDPRSVWLESGIAADHLPARETVQSIA